MFAYSKAVSAIAVDEIAIERIRYALGSKSFPIRTDAQHGDSSAGLNALSSVQIPQVAHELGRRNSRRRVDCQDFLAVP